MTFNEESLRKGIQFGLGSQGIWTHELEDKIFEEISNQALHQDAVSGAVCSSCECIIEKSQEFFCRYCWNER